MNDDQAQQEFAALLKRYPQCLKSTDSLKAYLNDCLNEMEPWRLKVLEDAYRVNAVQRLRQASSTEMAMSQLVQILQSDNGLMRDKAEWAIETWCIGLQIPLPARKPTAPPAPSVPQHVVQAQVEAAKARAEAEAELRHREEERARLLEAQRQAEAQARAQAETELRRREEESARLQAELHRREEEHARLKEQLYRREVAQTARQEPARVQAGTASFNANRASNLNANTWSAQASAAGFNASSSLRPPVAPVNASWPEPTRSSYPQTMQQALVRPEQPQQFAPQISPHQAPQARAEQALAPGHQFAAPQASQGMPRANSSASAFSATPSGGNNTTASDSGSKATKVFFNLLNVLLGVGIFPIIGLFLYFALEPIGWLLNILVPVGAFLLIIIVSLVYKKYWLGLSTLAGLGFFIFLIVITFINTPLPKT